MNAEGDLQKKIQNNELKELDESDPQVIAYVNLFRVLSQTEEYSSPEHLADSVIEALKKKQKKSVLKRDFFWFGTGILLLLAAGIYTVVYSEFKINLGFLNAFVYKGVLVFGICFIVVLHYIDRRMARKDKRFIA